VITRPLTVPLVKSEWAGRAWTFQENFFAKKRLIIAFGLAFYQCPSGVRLELCQDRVDATEVQRSMLDLSQVLDLSSVTMDLYLEAPTRMVVPAWGERFAGAPPLGQYLSSASRYGKTQASYQCDNLNAFQGIIEHLRPSFSGTFCWGLPTTGFHIALGWSVFAMYAPGCITAVDESTVREHRAVRGRWPNAAGVQKRTWFPSWSWAASDFFFEYLGPSQMDCRSCIVWPWEAGYALSGPGPFSTGVLRIEGEMAALGAVQLRTQWLGCEVANGQVFLDDMTLLDDRTMIFLRVYDMSTVSGDYTMLLGLEASRGGRGTHTRATTVTVSTATWNQAGPSRGIIDLA